ncbi:MAG: riboflavin synthase [Flavobacteriales bacterium]|nr:riboflavin synthase [Flavobacteriales bacterium]|tara:strand:+ start:2520 stop:3113 length:594 start_codon:yes stop_codon:yes gene_type:complete
MFTGIIEEIGIIEKIEKDRDNLIFYIHCSFLKEIKINQSIAHNGICLTVTQLNKNDYTVCVVNETIQKTNVLSFAKGTEINLERCLKIGDRLDGHFVQGHIDTVMKCVDIYDNSGSWVFKFKYDAKYARYIAPKGSIAINGVSLTIAEIKDDENYFTVAIIPYTFHETNFKFIKRGDSVNIEFDILTKQLIRLNEKG